MLIKLPVCAGKIVPLKMDCHAVEVPKTRH
jgi:hypothetical protein